MSKNCRIQHKTITVMTQYRKTEFNLQMSQNIRTCLLYFIIRVAIEMGSNSDNM